MMKGRRELLRRIPKIDEVLQDERLFFFMKSTPRVAIVDSVREVIGELRKDILEGRWSQMGIKETLMTEIVAHITDKKKKSLRRVINITGVMLHINLGRANLSDRAYESIVDVARNYADLGYDVRRGSRRSRHDHVEGILIKVTGAEATMVANNGAAATMLCLSALAKNEEVVVSREELVEIGGSFRAPGIIEQSGARLMDMGAANKIKPSNYLNTYHEDEAGILMRVHTSSYRILGFTQEAELPEVVELDKKLNLPAIYDIGGGLTADLTDYGVGEPTALDALKTDTDMILSNGDKLPGGPQGGIIAGKKEHIDKMEAHPPARAFRADKMTLATMEATFSEYSDIHQARRAIPVLNIVTIPAAELKDKAERLAGEIRRTTHRFTVEVETCRDQVGGDSAPTVLLDGYAVAVQGRTLVSEKIERLPRKEEIPIIMRIIHSQAYLDVRTIREDEFEYVVAAFTAMNNRQVEGR